jgi:hypothetical protein
MIAMKVRTRDDTKQVLRKAQQANIKSLGHAGGAIRLTARRSIRRRSGPSSPGKPPHTHRGLLKRAIGYAVEKEHDRVVVGPEQSVVGTSATAHEHGGPYKRQRYPKRPFMGPALEKIKDRLPRQWANSVR